MQRKLAVDYKSTLDWDKNPTLELDVFTQTYEYDAMNRPIKETKPNGVIISYNYNKASLLESVYGTEGAELNKEASNIGDS